MALLGRDTLVTGPLDEGVLLLETFRGKETLGTPYRYDLTLLSEEPNIPVDSVLGQSLTVRIKLDTGDTRFWNGIVTYFAKTGMSMRHTRYAAVLNPKLTLFDYARDCRVFHAPDGQNVRDLVSQVLSERGFSDVEWSLDGDFRRREYTVQYRESDFNFVQRLLEEEGIYYFFEHEDDKHTLVFANYVGAHAKVSGYEEVLYLPKQHRQAREEEHLWSLSVAGSLYAGKFSVLRGYDYTEPRARAGQIEQTNSSAGQPGSDFEDYDYPGGLYEKTDAGAEAQIRLDGAHVANTVIEVEGNTMGLGVGDLLKLRRPASVDGEFNPFWDEADFDKEYLITSASYFVSINQYETGDVAASDEPFRATYTLLDSQAPFRPARTALKPRIEGPQTALVVGSTGEEIYTDKYGRVRVQFDWDRLGRRDEKSSCWVRVAQVWAGKQWGAIHIPRVGQEVIVEFLDGDPDRPIVTGRVYNTDSMPPYALPDNKTQSGIKSRSSKGGSASNFNEFRFEDLKGSEQIFLQAEKDLDIYVKNDESRVVGHDRTKVVENDESSTIKGNRTEEVVKDETISIHGSRTETVDKDESITIGGGRNETVGGDESVAIGGGRSKAVGANESIAIGGSRSEAVGKNESVTIGGARTVAVAKADSLSVGGDRKQQVGGSDQLQAGKKILVDGGDEVTLKSGSASITLKKDGTILLKGKDVSIRASGKINAKASSDVIIKGSKVSGN
ncbi:MAG: type VI secretion system tip protein VgrG [Deltaproteobacteria bacterium]|nr:type VI secretion system tip protein VgrG [Deltaproteobacteria bacterium]